MEKQDIIKIVNCKEDADKLSRDDLFAMISKLAHRVEELEYIMDARSAKALPGSI